MKLNKKTFLVFACFLIAALSGYAQNATLRGFIYVDKTGESALYSTVYLQGTQYGENAVVNGYFSINQVPPGNYTLVVAYLGYDTLKEPITLVKNQILTKKLYVKQSAQTLSEVSVSAEQKSRETETQVSTYHITQTD